MGWRIVRQPNGNYARFSEVVDNFTHTDMDREGAVDMCRIQFQLSAAEAEVKVRNAETNLGRWAECMEIIRNVHGEEEAERVLLEIDSAKP